MSKEAKLLEFAEFEWRKATDKLTDKSLGEKDIAYYVGKACAYNSIIVQADPPTYWERIVEIIGRLKYALSRM